MPEETVGLAGIAVGSNLGDREQNLRDAVERLAGLGKVLDVSPWIDTAPVGFVDQPRFLNGAVLLETSLSPQGLLEAMLGIERELGRVRSGVPAKGPRVIDLDLIFYDDLILTMTGLTLPHPAMQDRTFVLEPLAELAPEWRHPVLGLTVREMLAAARGERPQV